MSSSGQSNEAVPFALDNGRQSLDHVGSPLEAGEVNPGVEDSAGATLLNRTRSAMNRHTIRMMMMRCHGNVFTDAQRTRAESPSRAVDLRVPRDRERVVRAPSDLRVVVRRVDRQRADAVAMVDRDDHAVNVMLGDLPPRGWRRR
jgi:hypothetical protein